LIQLLEVPVQEFFKRDISYSPK